MQVFRLIPAWIRRRVPRVIKDWLRSKLQSPPNTFKKLIQNTFNRFGYAIIKKSSQYSNIENSQIDIIVNTELKKARNTIFKDCPDPQYTNSYYKHEISGWGPIPSSIYLYKQIRKDNEVRPKALDIGCAFGTMLAYCSNLGFDPYGVDFVSVDKYLGKTTQEKYSIKYHQLIIEKEELPFEDEEFEIIIMTEVLEHFHFQPLDVLKKVHRILKKSGYLFLTTPALGLDWAPKYYGCSFEEIPSYNGQDHEWMDTHHKIYDKEELHRLLSKANFKPFVGLHVCPNTRREGLYAIAKKTNSIEPL